MAVPLACECLPVSAPFRANWFPGNYGNRPGASGNHRLGPGTVVHMDWDEDIASRLMAAIAALPPEEQCDAIHAVLSGVLKEMPRESLLDVRADVRGRLKPAT